MSSDGCTFAEAVELPPDVLSGFRDQFGVSLEYVMGGGQLPTSDILFLRDGGQRRKRVIDTIEDRTPPPPKRVCGTLPCGRDVLNGISVRVGQQKLAEKASPTPQISAVQSRSSAAAIPDDTPAIAFVEDLLDISNLSAGYYCGDDPFLTKQSVLECPVPGMELDDDSDDNLTRGPAITEREMKTPAYREHIRRLCSVDRVLRAVPECTDALSSIRRMQHFIDPDLSDVCSPRPKDEPLTLSLALHSSPAKGTQKYEKQDIGSLRKATWQLVEQHRAQASLLKAGDPFSSVLLGGSYKTAANVSIAFSDMLRYSVLRGPHFNATRFKETPGFVALVQHDELTPMVPEPLDPVEMHMYSGRLPSVAFTRVPWTQKHGVGAAFPLPGDCSHPIGVMVSNVGRVAVAPASVGEDELFVVRVNRKTGVVTYAEPVDWRYAAGQTFPRWHHSVEEVQTALEQEYRNRILRRLWRDGQYHRVPEAELQEIRPGPLREKTANKVLQSLTRSGAYHFPLGPPETKPVLPLVRCALAAYERFSRWRGSIFDSTRAVDPFVAGPVLKQYLKGEGLIIGSGPGAATCLSMNLSKLFPLKSGVGQASNGDHLVPKIDHPNGHYPPKKNGRKGIAGTRKDRRTSTDEELNREAMKAIKTRENSDDTKRIAEILRARMKKPQRKLTKAEIRARVSDKWELQARIKKVNAASDPTQGLGQNKLREWGFNKHAFDRQAIYRALLYSFSMQGGDLLQRVKRDSLKDNYVVQDNNPLSLRTLEAKRPPFKHWARHIRYQRGSLPSIVFDSRQITVTPDGIIDKPSEPNSASVWAISLVGEYAELVHMTKAGRDQPADTKGEWFRQRDEKLRRFELEYGSLCPESYFATLVEGVKRGVL